VRLKLGVLGLQTFKLQQHQGPNAYRACQPDANQAYQRQRCQLAEIREMQSMREKSTGQTDPTTQNNTACAMNTPFAQHPASTQLASARAARSATSPVLLQAPPLNPKPHLKIRLLNPHLEQCLDLLPVQSLCNRHGRNPALRPRPLAI
jgi:hypothetical protein